jgi:hypothetical protein
MPLRALRDAEHKMLRVEWYKKYRPLEKLEIDNRTSATSRTLLENVCRYRAKQCSDSRDLFYSLTSLSSVSRKLTVNYECTPAQLVKTVLCTYEAEWPCLCKAELWFRLLHVSKASISASNSNVHLFTVETRDITSGATTCIGCDHELTIDGLRFLYKILLSRD